MYTVLRVMCTELMTQEHDNMVKKIRINGDGEGIKDGEDIKDEVSNTYSFSICEDGKWNDHIKSIEEVVKINMETISKLSSIGVSMEFDVAVEPCDLVSLGSFFHLGMSTLEYLVSSKIEIEISVYP